MHTIFSHTFTHSLSPPPLSFLLRPRYNLWNSLLEEVDLWGYPVLYFSSCEFCVWRGDKGGPSLLNFGVCVVVLPCSTGAGGSSTIRTVARRSFGPLQRIHPGQPAWIRDLSDWRWTFSAVSHLFSRIPANDFLFQRQYAGMWQWALCQLSQIGKLQVREWVHDHANCRVVSLFWCWHLHWPTPFSSGWSLSCSPSAMVRYSFS